MSAVKKWISVILLFCCMFAWSDFPVQARQNSYITFEGDKTSGRFSFGPGASFSSTDLFVGLRDLMPGDTKTQTITVNNYATDKIELVLYIKSDWESDNESELLGDKINITFTADGNAEDFDTSPISEEQRNGWVLVGEINSAGGSAVQDLSEWTYLGTLHVGGSVDVKATVDVPITLGNGYQEKTGRVEILVQAEVRPDSRYQQGYGSGGKTGDTASILVWLVLIAVSADILFLIWKKRREKRDEQKRRQSLEDK